MKETISTKSRLGVIPMCFECKLPAIWDEEEWLYRCPKCKAEGCVYG